MSGPNAELVQLYVRTTADAAFWGLELWSDQGEAHVECAECGSGDLLTAGFRGKPFMITDLIARLEAHIPQCRGAKEPTSPPASRDRWRAP